MRYPTSSKNLLFSPLLLSSVILFRGFIIPLGRGSGTRTLGVPLPFVLLLDLLGGDEVGVAGLESECDRDGDG